MLGDNPERWTRRKTSFFEPRNTEVFTSVTNESTKKFVRTFFRALPGDDDESLRAYLQRLNISDRKRFIEHIFNKEYLGAGERKSTGFCCKDTQSSKKNFAQRYITGIDTSLSICIAFKAVKCLKVLLDAEADVTTIGRNSNNIIHILVIASALETDPEAISIYKNIYFLLMKDYIVNVETRKQLLYQENEDHLRPIELASVCETFSMVEAIWNTAGVYVFLQSKKGMWANVLYDVSDYQAGNPQSRPLVFSVFAMLAQVDAMKMEEMATKEFYRSEFIQQWFRERYKNTRIPLLVGVIFRTYYCIMFYLSMLAWQFDFLESHMKNTSTSHSTANNTGIAPIAEDLNSTFISTNNTNRCSYHQNNTFIDGLKKSNSYFLLAIGANSTFLVLIYVIFDSIMVYQVRKHAHVYYLSKRKSMTKYWIFYDQCAFWQSVFFLISITMNYIPGSPLLIIQFLQASSTILNIWSALYVIQIIPYLGWYTVIFQTILGDLFQFIIFMLIIMSSFTGVFFPHLYVRCTKGFHTFYNSFYSTFKIMLNMIPIEDGGDSDDIYVLHVYHIVYVLIVAVLLINFLIGIMSNSINRIVENRDIVMLLQRIWLTMISEIYAHKISCKPPKGYIMKDGKYFLPIQYYIPDSQEKLTLLLSRKTKTSTLNDSIEQIMIKH